MSDDKLAEDEPRYPKAWVISDSVCWACAAREMREKADEKALSAPQSDEQATDRETGHSGSPSPQNGAQRLACGCFDQRDHDLNAPFCRWENA